MIMSRTPLRITLAGGGTDLPDYYSKYGGSVTSLALNKYIYVSFKRNILDNLVRLRYLHTEEVTHADLITNERARCCLQKFKIYDKCELTSIGDLPANTGLGSSGSYLVGLINVLQTYQGHKMSLGEIAEMACDLEINVLNEPVGKQDQYIAAYGGIQTFNIDKTGKVSRSTCVLSDVDRFIKNNRIYYTGTQRNASEILRGQKKDPKKLEEGLKKIHELSHKFIECLNDSDYDQYGRLLNTHWEYKRQLSESMSNNQLDSLYQTLIDTKLILGGKIIGAGGGGFLLLYCPSQHNELDSYMGSCGFTKLEYGIDTKGSTIVYDT